MNREDGQGQEREGKEIEETGCGCQPAVGGKILTNTMKAMTHNAPWSIFNLTTWKCGHDHLLRSQKVAWREMQYVVAENCKTTTYLSLRPYGTFGKVAK